MLDLGSGYGKPSCDIAVSSKAEVKSSIAEPFILTETLKVWGVDLSAKQVEQANKRVFKSPATSASDNRSLYYAAVYALGQIPRDRQEHTFY